MFDRKILTALSLCLCASTLSWAPEARAETALERGDYLVNAIAACGNCHTPRGPEGPMPGLELAGAPDFYDIPEMKIHTPNITPDVETGIGSWTDEQIITAIREGRRPDGSILGPFMPFAMYRDLSDTDVKAIVAYLRQVPAVHREVPRSVFNIPLPPNYGPPVTHVADTPRDDPVAYGGYLAGPVGHCMECHTPWNETGADYANRLGAGGNPFVGPWGTSTSANITPTGLKSRSDDDIKTMVTTGVRPDGSPMLPPMGFGYYANMTEEDLDAIVAYLRSLPPR